MSHVAAKIVHCRQTILEDSPSRDPNRNTRLQRIRVERIRAVFSLDRVAVGCNLERNQQKETRKREMY